MRVYVSCERCGWRGGGIPAPAHGRLPHRAQLACLAVAIWIANRRYDVHAVGCSWRWAHR